jgi:uncharacterized protein (DUF1697 family)
MQSFTLTFRSTFPVIARSPAEIGRVIAANPFAVHVHQRPHLVRVIFLTSAPSRARVERMMAVDAIRDTCRVIGNHVYVD